MKAARICELGLEDVIAVMKAHPYKPASRSGSARAVQENAAGVLWSLHNRPTTKKRDFFRIRPLF